MCFLPQSSTLINTYSCFLTSERLNIVANLKNAKILPTISNIFKSTTWTERELMEFNVLKFSNITDSRRLLTDYTYHQVLTLQTYKTTSYDLIYQDLYIYGCYSDFFYFYFFLLSYV